MSVGLRAKISAVVFATVVALVLSACGAVTSAYGAEVAPPATSKTLVPNNDGTYTLSLSVTGKSSSSITSDKADVIVILDTSASMNWDEYGNEPSSYYYYGPSRLEVAKSAVDNLASQLLANNTEANPDRVQLSLVSFSELAKVQITQTTDEQAFDDKVDSLYAYEGTNWEDALKKANSIPTREGATVYVIFVSDGDPTFRDTQGGYTTNEDEPHGYSPNYYYGTGESDYNNKNYRYAVSAATNIVQAGKHFYPIGAFGNATRMQSLATQSGAPRSNYYDATDQTALNEAFANIVHEITNATFYQNVKVTDGLTTLTGTMFNTDQSAAYSSYTRSGGAYGSGETWRDAPKAQLAGGKVTWDLGDLSLEDGVTYTASFTVWPKQEAYDLVTDLNNGIKTYDGLTDEEKSQVARLDGGGYGLKTNTDAVVSFDQVKTKTTTQEPDGFEEGEPANDGYTYTYDSSTGTYVGKENTPGTGTIDNPDPMPLTTSTIKIKKDWKDSLDPSQRPESVTLRVVRDDQTYIDVVLNEGNSWTAEIEVAPGLKTDSYTFDAGHDYTVREPGIDASYELIAPMFHPMITNGVLAAGGPFTGTTVTATNNLKGSLDITKKVTTEEGITAPQDKEFKFTVKFAFSIIRARAFGAIMANGVATAAGFDTPAIDVTYGIGAVKYIVRHADGTESDPIPYTIGGTITLKAGETAHLINIPSGAHYTVEETDIPSGFSKGAETGTSGTIWSNTTSKAEVTNKYDLAPVTASIPVTKSLSAAEGLTAPGIAGSYTFSLASVDGAPMPQAGGESVSNPDAGGGTASFGAISFSRPGTYAYTVTEAGSVRGVTNDALATTGKRVEVVVSDNGDGTMSAEVRGADGSGASTTFSNSYDSPAPAQATIAGAKALSGRALAEGQFSFSLAPVEDGAPMPASATASNGADGSFSFGPISYDASKVGTWHYTVSEADDGQPGYSYDGTARQVSVEVTDDGTGALSAEVSYAGGGSAASFSNSYSAAGTTDLSFSKVLRGAALQAGQFSFELKDETGNTVKTATNDAAGNIVFTQLRYTLDQVGTHHYTVREVNDGRAGFTYDDSVLSVDVAVSDNGDGTLAVTPTYSARTFTNSYHASNSIQIGAQKDLAGRDVAEGEFSFVLTPQGNAPGTAQTTTNGVGGSITFDPIPIDESIFNNPERGEVEIAGLESNATAEEAATGDPEPTRTRTKTFTYTIGEQAGSLGGITYDTHVETVTVTVTDNGDGTIGVEVSYDADGAVFHNSYIAAGGTAPIRASKTLEGSDLREGQLGFVLAGSDGTNLTVTNAADGTIDFGTLAFEKNAQRDDTGTHIYTISEVNDAATGFIYDEHRTTVTVEVTDNGDGTLATEVSYDGSTTFENRYEPFDTTALISAVKKLDGRDLADGEFTFQLEAVGDAPLPANTTAVNDRSGNVMFVPIVYTQPGEYSYAVSEIVGDDPTITYDETLWRYTVKVVDVNGQLEAMVYTDDGGDHATFTNAYTPPEPIPNQPFGFHVPDNPNGNPDGGDSMPQTGDSPWIIIIAALVGAIAATLLLVAKKRK